LLASLPRAPASSKVVRKSIARVLTVYRANIRAALKSKVTDESASKKGKVRSGGW
jgi:hypothetical protein